MLLIRFKCILLSIFVFSHQALAQQVIIDSRYHGKYTISDSCHNEQHVLTVDQGGYTLGGNRCSLFAIEVDGDEIFYKFACQREPQSKLLVRGSWLIGSNKDSDLSISSGDVWKSYKRCHG